MKKNTTTAAKERSHLLKRHFLRICLCCVGAALSLTEVSALNEPASNQKPNFSIENVTGPSDWFVKLKVTSDPSIEMDCWGSDTYSYTIYKNGVVVRTISEELVRDQIILVEHRIANEAASWRITYKTDGSLFNCHYWKDSNVISASTGRLLAPVSVEASDSSSKPALQNSVKLTWRKGTEVPTGYHHYLIFRDGDFSAPITQVAGTENIPSTTRYEWTDTGLQAGEAHTYSIVTWVSSSTYGVHFSDTVTVTGKTFPKLKASDGEFLNSVDIKWDQMDGLATSLKIFRDGVEIHSRGETEMSQTPMFKDHDRVPGFKHTYTLIPYEGGKPYATMNDTGYARRNGRITGSVKAPFGGPVQGAIVYAEPVTAVPQSEGNPQVYSDTTNANGLFEIRDIYYHTEADFKVYAVKGDHEFNPASYEQVTLDLTAPASSLPSPSFVDISSFTVEGHITQAAKGDVAAVENVEILVDGLFKGTKTNSDGYYALTVEEIGDYTISARFHEHSFEPAEIPLQVETDVTGVDFMDIEMDTLSGTFSGGCDIYIGRASLRIFNSKNPTAGIDTTIWTNEGSGYYSVILPSRGYTVEVIDFLPEETGSVTKDQVIAFFGISDIDLTYRSVVKNYVYRKPPEVEIIGFPEAGCAPFNVPIMEQIVNYPLEIRVFESFSSESCLTSSGFIVIYDEIKDGFSGPDTVVLENGVGRYDVLAGAPNILAGGSHPYQKKILIHANVEGQTADVEQYVLVQGNRPREQTFATVSPEVPFLILRDPPGDGSYSYLSENTTFTSSMSFYSQLSGSANVWHQTKVGIEQEAGVGVFIPFKLWGEIKSTMEVGASLKTQLELGLEFAVANKFSTSGNQNITGSDGDVFVGSAMNILYALTDVIEYDADACEVVTSEEIIMAPDGFATTFMYTENHIREVLIPQLDQIKRTYEEEQSDSAAFYANQITVWMQTLQANADLKAEADFVENRSFSAGAGFESSTTLKTSASVSLEFSLYLEQSIALSAGLEVGGTGKSLGAEVKYRMEVGGSASTGVQHEKTVGYSLNDDDVGDFFSVDIKRDRAYATPVFSLVSGRSSCPWETGSQPREGIQLTIDKTVRYDIPEDDAAAFRLNLGNTSQSDEDQVYNLVFLQESNPEGAVLTLGGSQVQGGIKTPYNIPSGGSVDVTVTVRKGPNASAYQDLKFALLSGCDDGVIGDTVAFSVYFISDCSPITVSKPLNNWRVNATNGDELQVEFSDYDKSKLNNVVLQYRRMNSAAWESSTILSTDDLLDDKTTLMWNVGSVGDGDYEIRAKVACGQENEEYGFSEPVAGYIDRTPAQLVGIPQPADGTYTKGDEISASFNENLNCFTMSAENVTFTEKASGTTYPVGVGCIGNKIQIVPLTEELFQDKVIVITISDVEDAYANVREDDISWEFDIVSADFKIEADTDSDGDGVPDQDDNCAYTTNADQEDADGNGIGDVCDADADGDGVSNNGDNCPYTSNAGQEDSDGDGIGDVCSDDRDQDGIKNDDDNCPSTFNPLQEDADEDGVGDACHLVTGLGDEISSLRTLDFYPNPASGTLNINFELERDGSVTIGVFDVSNRLVLTLMQDYFAPGKYSRTFLIGEINDGLYFLRLNNNGRTQTAKLLIKK